VTLKGYLTKMLINEWSEFRNYWIATNTLLTVCKTLERKKK